MKTQLSLHEVIRSGRTVANTGQTLTIDLIRKAIEIMPFTNEHVVELDEQEPVADYEILRRTRSL